MGSLPQLSVLRGPVRRDTNPGESSLLHRLLESAATKNADKTAIHSNGATTFAQLDGAASRMARALVRRVRDSPTNSDGDSLIAVSLPPGLPLIETLLAIWKAGAAYLPLDAAFPPGRVKHILSEARPLLVVCDDSIDTEPFGDTPWVRYSELKSNSGVLASTPLSDAEVLPTNGQPLALVLYTSGSTGVPKGVRLPHETVLNRLRWQWHEFPYSATEEVCAFKTALTFVDSVAELWGPLLQGRAVVVLPKDVTSDPERLVEALERYQVQI